MIAEPKAMIVNTILNMPARTIAHRPENCEKIPTKIIFRIIAAQLIEKNSGRRTCCHFSNSTRLKITKTTIIKLVAEAMIKLLSKLYEFSDPNSHNPFVINFIHQTFPSKS